ncbi:hypothetical protein [Egbenema bharatensis]|uniref:hypothetical protein n=1 Tax=Egbenema bharatensis TaxID=3463334 RepID=UPI003A843028
MVIALEVARTSLSLQAIQTAYEKLLSECQYLLHNVFGVRNEEKLREDLRVRAGHLAGIARSPGGHYGGT